jgi:hypothetical protein
MRRRTALYLLLGLIPVLCGGTYLPPPANTGQLARIRGGDCRGRHESLALSGVRQPAILSPPMARPCPKAS